MSERPLRADARRNRARVLGAARQAFAAEGVGVSLDEIARRAGVGAGTVHRHFPTKEALFEAVVVDHLEQLTLQARAALDLGDAGPAFFTFLREMISEADTKRDLADALTGEGVSMSEGTLRVAAALQAAFGELLVQAQAARAVRADVDRADVQAIVLAAVAAERHRADTDHPGRLAALVCECLRPVHRLGK
jgi:AcrR family transcriptional regulator